MPRSKPRPVAAGFQKFCDAPYSLQPAAPWTCSMHTRRVRLAARAAAVLAKTVRAGTIASNNGKAIETPSPRKAVRRDMCFPVRNMVFILSCAWGPTPMRGARDGSLHSPAGGHSSQFFSVRSGSLRSSILLVVVFSSAFAV